MNILFYQHQYPAFGGIETVTTMLANAFAADGHKVAIVSFIHKDGADLLSRLHPSVTWHELPEPALYSAANLADLKAFFADFKPDKTIFQDSYVNIQQLLFKAMGDDRPVTAEHSCPRFSLARRTKPLSPVELAKRVILAVMRPFAVVKRRRYEALRRRVLFDRSSAYVALSENYRLAIEKLVGEERMDKFRVIPNPIDGKPSSEDLSGKKRQILFVGSLIVTKGVDRLVDIWARLAPRHPDWEFVVVGDGVERPRLESIVANRNIPRVRFKGFKRDTSRYYHDAAIFAMASDFEGWPMVLGEAMKEGCVPVVYGSFAAATDIIDDGVNGRVIAPFDKNAYLTAMEKLMDDDATRREMASASRVKAGKYTLDTIKKAWYDLFMGEPRNAHTAAALLRNGI